MKRWQIFALLMAAVLVAGYFYYRGALRTERAHTSTASEYSSADLGGPAHINWQQISRPDDGFRIEMPADPRDLQVPAYNETGGTEPVKMIFSNPDGDTTFAVTWRSEEHTSELQSRRELVCRLLLEKKKISSAHPGPADDQHRLGDWGR